MGTNTFDEVWLYGINNGTAPATLFTQWGGITVNDQLQIVLNGSVGRTLVADGRIVTTGTISAWLAAAGTVSVDGFVNRIVPGSSLFDPTGIVTDWSNRVVTNGGAVPSLLTQAALISFVATLNGYGILSKMVGLNCFVPDSLTAAITPLIKPTSSLISLTFDPWINNLGFFVGSDLTVNGLTGNASNKVLNTGIFPSNFLASGLGGYAWYAKAVTATGFDLGCYNGTRNFIAAAKHTDNNSYAYNSGSSGSNVVTAASPGAGFYAATRVSPTDHRLFFAKSSSAFAQIGATDTLAESGLYLDQPIYVFSVNLSSGTIQLPTSNTLSFVAFYTGMSANDCSNLYTAVQSLRTILGGGFV